MKTVYKVRNFRTFGEDGATVPFAPITLLTGANCSGKSSIVKSLVIFEKFLKQVLADTQRSNTFLPFNHCPDFTDSMLKLGGFRSAYSTKSAKGKSISCSYEVFSKYLGQNVTVEYDFVESPSDELDNGALGSIMISDSDGNTLFRWEQDDKYDLSFHRLSQVNLMHLKNRFITFAAWKLNSKLKIDKAPWITYEDQDIRNVVRQRIDATDKELFKLSKGSGYSSVSESIIRLRCAESSLLTEVLMSDSLFPMPVLELTRNMSKSQTLKYLRDKIGASDMPEKSKSDVNSVLNYFEKSLHETLADYFAIWERQNILLRKNLESFDNTKDFYESVFNVLALTRKYGASQQREIYNAMLLISSLLDESFAASLSDRIKPNECLHEHYELFLHYVNVFLYEVLMPSFAGNIKYLGTSKIDAKRVYFIDDRSNDFGELFWEYFNLKKKWTMSMLKLNSEYHPGDFMNRWIQRFELGKSLEIRSFGSGQGISIYIDDRVIADEGFGATQILAVLLNIEVAIMNSIYKSAETNLSDRQPFTLILEEPEVHLHPKFQSLLADLFYDAYSQHGIHFIVETHSEYMIRKSQVLVAQMNFRSHEEADRENGFRTIYVPKSGKPYSLFYRKDGKFAEDFGSGFFDESSNLVFEIM